MAKTLISDPILPPPPPNFFREFYLYYLGIVPSYHLTQFKGKLMNQTGENGKNPNFRPDFDLSGPNLPPPPKFFCGFYVTSTSSYRLFQAIIRHNFQVNQ